MHRRITLPLAALGTLVLALAGCTGGSTPAQPEEGALTPITVGVLPIVDTAAAWLGVEEGIFEDYGLDVTLQVASGGATVVPSVVSGDFQFGFSNAASVLQAGGRGLPLRIVAPAVATTGNPEADNGAIYAAPGAGITRPAELEGRTVAVNALNSIGTMLISNVVDQDGGDSSRINFVELGFPDIPAALANNSVDAAWIFEPFLTVAKGQGAELVSHVLVETDPNLMLSVYFTSTGYAEANPEIVEAFTSAVTESLAFAEANPDRTRAVLGTYTEISPEIAAQLTLPRFPTEIDTNSLNLLADLALRYGLVNEPVDVQALLR